MPPSYPTSAATAIADLCDALAGFFDPDWYASRYPDIVAAGHEPL